MKDSLRDALEAQIIQDGIDGDTTVLAEILKTLSNSYVYASLRDGTQKGFRYYEIHVTGKNGFSTSLITDFPMDDDDIILKAYEDDILHGDDCHHVDYIQELTFEEWEMHFKF